MMTRSHEEIAALLHDLQGAISVDVRCQAAEELAQLSDSNMEIVGALISAKLTDRHPDVRRAAAEAVLADVHQAIVRKYPDWVKGEIAKAMRSGYHHLPEKPSQVNNAVYLLYASIIIGIFSSILELSYFSSTLNPPYSVAQSSIGFNILVMVITFTILLLLVAMISRGKNWARIVYLVLYVLGFPCSIVVLFQVLPTNICAALVGIVQAVLQLVAIVFLFQRPSSAWFKGELDGGQIDSGKQP